MRDWIAGVIILCLAAVILYFVGGQQVECNSRGGVLIQGPLGYQCLVTK